jgi:hypothetical protein
MTAIARIAWRAPRTSTRSMTRLQLGMTLRRFSKFFRCDTLDSSLRLPAG